MEMVNKDMQGILPLTYYAVTLVFILSTLGNFLSCSILVMLATVILVPLVTLVRPFKLVHNHLLIPVA
jgi:hypothetical protein